MPFPVSLWAGKIQKEQRLLLVVILRSFSTPQLSDKGNDTWVSHPLHRLLVPADPSAWVNLESHTSDQDISCTGSKYTNRIRLVNKSRQNRESRAVYKK